MPRKAARIPTGQRDVDRAIDEVRDVANALVDGTLAGATLFINQQLVDGVAYRLRHGLGRNLRGWIICDLTGPSSTGRIERIIPSASNAYDPTVELWLKATGYTATITVSVLCF